MVDEKEAPKPDSAKILDELSKGRAPQKTRAQRKARSRVVILILLLLPLIGGVAWLAWQQWLLSSSLPAIEARLVAAESAVPQRGQDIVQREEQLATEFSRLQTEFQRQLEEKLASLPTDGLDQEERDRQLVDLATRTARDTTQAAISELEARLAQQENSTASEITRLRNQVAEMSARLRSADADPRRGWRLFEAEYLLSMAGRKLRFERDVTSAIELYELADAALAESASDESFPIRQSLARELASLRAVEVPDIESLFLRLDILLAQADTMNLVGKSIDSMRSEFTSNTGDSEVTSQSAGGEEALTVASVYEDVLEFLRSVFVWRQLDEPAQSLVAARLGGTSELKLIIEQAKLALLSHDGILFDRQLQSAEEWLKRNADLNAASVTSALSELEHLRAVDLQPPLPLLSDALRGIVELNASAAQ